MKLMEIFGRKESVKLSPLTQEERDLIKRLFPDSNVMLKMGNGEYVFPSNAHAVYKKARLSFYKKGDELRVSIAHHSTDSDASNPRAVPLTHTDHVASEDELERIKRDL